MFYGRYQDICITCERSFKAQEESFERFFFSVSLTVKICVLRLLDQNRYTGRVDEDGFPGG